jgi:hypothetical protein
MEMEQTTPASPPAQEKDSTVEMKQTTSVSPPAHEKNDAELSMSPQDPHTAVRSVHGFKVQQAIQDRNESFL